ncbi:hypothetical protein [Ralstonia solanacearum]|uniref:hypothetical protein n=1 Tax=Ralstonia solanacearum TaxID=305 RepID=UPI0006DBF95F|nr:hypothetical protein [Ralstonia solanacearum]
MAYAWRIDTLDPNGGLTFVSWREETLCNDDALEEAPVFYIGAPSFIPQPVANRGVAFAAERYGFQLGLLDRDSEVTFETLDNVAEFMRRLYLTSARGDPTDDGAATPPQPRDDSPLRGFELEAPSENTPLAEAVSEFVRGSSILTRGVANPWKWTSALGALDTSMRSHAEKQLLHGAAIVLVEMLSRFPSFSDVEGMEHWRVGAVTFVEIVHRLGLWPEMVAHKNLCQICHHFLEKTWTQIEQPLSSTLSVDQAAAGVLHIFSRQTLYPPWIFDLGIAAPILSTIEPMDELARLPIPRPIANKIRTPRPDRASVATLLSTALGCPASMEGSADVEALLLFAAARVVAVNGASFVAPRIYVSKPDAWDGITLMFRRERMLNAARTWLAENLARVAFDSAIEKMIANVATESGVHVSFA